MKGCPDEVFDENLEHIQNMWAEKKDTLEMAEALNIPESQVYFILQCHIEGMFDWPQESGNI